MLEWMIIHVTSEACLHLLLNHCKKRMGKWLPLFEPNVIMHWTEVVSEEIMDTVLSLYHYRRRHSMAPIFFKQKFIVLHPHHPWTVRPFTTFEFAELHSILHFCLNTRMLSTHLFSYTASKVLGSNGEIRAWDLSADPFPSSCYFFFLVHSICKNHSVLSSNQAHNNLIFVFHNIQRASKIFPGAYWLERIPG